MIQASHILSRHKLRKTLVRERIINKFIQKQHALSQPDLESALEGVCDRVTIYRTLTTFLEKGILHKVLDDSGRTKYAICSSDCDNDIYHSHDHVHFKCQACGTTVCIDDVKIPIINIPQGYKLDEVSVLLQGTCAECTTN